MSGTTSRLDEMLVQELQGGSTSEIYLAQEIFDANVTPALDLRKSNTQNEESFNTEAEQESLLRLRSKIREAIAEGSPTDGMKYLIEQISQTDDNSQILDKSA